MSEDIETILMDFYEKWEIPISRISFVVYAISKGVQERALEILGYYDNTSSDISEALTDALGSFYPEIPMLLRSLGRSKESEKLFDKLVEHYMEVNKLLEREDNLTRKITRDENLREIKQAITLTNKVGYKDWTSKLRGLLTSFSRFQNDKNL